MDCWLCWPGWVLVTVPLVTTFLTTFVLGMDKPPPRFCLLSSRTVLKHGDTLGHGIMYVTI